MEPVIYIEEIVEEDPLIISIPVDFFDEDRNQLFEE